MQGKRDSAFLDVHRAAIKHLRCSGIAFIVAVQQCIVSENCGACYDSYVTHLPERGAGARVACPDAGTSP
jgi:hypothetical protein